MLHACFFPPKISCSSICLHPMDICIICIFTGMRMTACWKEWTAFSEAIRFLLPRLPGADFSFDLSFLLGRAKHGLTSPPRFWEAIQHHAVPCRELCFCSLVAFSHKVQLGIVLACLSSICQAAFLSPGKFHVTFKANMIKPPVFLEGLLLGSRRIHSPSFLLLLFLVAARNFGL